MAGDERAEAQIRVERFVPPVTRIDHTLGEFLTPAMRDLPFELNLHYFDGATFARGHVVVSARVGEQEIPVATRDVTGSGPHAFTVPAAVLARVRGVLEDGQRFDVKIDVTDATGRSDTLRRSLQIARNPYTVTIELDRQGYAPGERVDATVRIVDLNHVVVRGKHVELRGLGATLAGDTGDDGVVHFRFPMPPRATTVSAWVSDVGEAIARSTLSVTSVHPMQSTVAQTTLREREPVDVTVRFPADVVPVEDVVHADVVDSSGAIIESLLVPVDRTGSAPTGHLRFDAPSWGSMLLTLFATAAPRDHATDPRAMGLVTDGQNIPVTPGATIDITLDPLPAEARPGDRVHVSARVTRDGVPIEARVGASVVDQAVISLLDPLEHDPRDRFYNPQQKVLAETGSQTLTWPVVQRTWGGDRYDIGWPSAFGFHGGDPGEGESWEAAQTAPLRLGTLLESIRRPPSGIGPSGIISPFGGMAESGADFAVGDAFGYGGLGAAGTGWGGGGTGEGTIGMGALGTMGQVAGRRGVRLESAPGPTPRLVLRTNFSETAAWLPSLDAHEGRVAFDVVLPDTITRQQVSLVATDRHGGIAVSRTEIPVRQAFYVRSDLPPTLVENDAVGVSLVARVLGDAATHATLSLASDDLRVESLGGTEVDVAAQGSAGVRFRVTAQHPGRATYHFAGTGAGLEDRGERALYVEPAGAPVHTEDESTLGAGGSYALTFDDTGARYAVHTLSVALPTAVALTDVLAASDTILGGDVESLAGELDVATSLMQLDALSAAPGTGRAIRERAARSLLAVLASQGRDGGFGWWWDAPSEVSVTAFVLDVLERALHANLPVPVPALERAAQFLSEALSHGRLLSPRAIAVWEGSGSRVRSVLTAQAAAALARLPVALRDDTVRGALTSVRPVLAQSAASASSGPLEIAYAVYALLAIDAIDAAAAHVPDAGVVSRL
ncbi:MAG: alpha-2-macroglobulin family protein, partial [Deltaproteobacteria bacterium]